MRVAVEYPLPRRDIGPRGGYAAAADPAPKQDSHPYVVAVLKPDALKRQLDFDRVAVIGDLARTVPNDIRFPSFTGCRRVECIHLNTAWIDHQMI